MTLVRRAFAICVHPGTEWQVIAAEPTPPREVLVRYFLPLAVFGALVGALTGWGLAINWQRNIGWPDLAMAAGSMLWTGIIFVVLFAFVNCLVAAIMLDGLAATFGATPDRAQAFKLAAYASTPLLLAVLLRAVSSPLMFVAVIAAAAYSVYLLYVGIPILLRAPVNRSLAFTLLVAVVAGTASRWIAGALLPLFRL